MNTAIDIIHQIESLPYDEKQKVIAYCCSEIVPKNLNSEYEQILIQLEDDIQNGINVSPTFTSMEKAIEWLQNEQDNNQ